MAEILALPEPAEIADIEINSDNLWYYLVNFDGVFAHAKVTFAPRLDLQGAEVCLRNLHASEKLGYVYSQDVKDVAESFDPNVFQDSVEKAIGEERRRVLNQEFNRQESVERSQVIYYDADNDLFKISPINHGEHRKVSVATFDYFEPQQGHIPLVEIHTHPHNSLFSPQDYARMILSSSVNVNYRMIKACLVLCSNVQILVLVRPETVFYTSEQFDEFMRRYDLDQSESGKRINEINKRLQRIFDGYFIEKIKGYRRGKREFEEDLACYAAGLYSEDEFKFIQQRYRMIQIKGFEEFPKIYEARVSEEVDELRSEKEKLYVYYGIEVAREVNPKLYISRDFRHFQEFSA